MKFLPALTELVFAYQAFNRYSSAHVQSLGLTMTQFDIIATLGNQPPMTYKTLGEQTLVTKGTLTGVVARLVTKGWLYTRCNPEDARSQLVGLTEAGKALFETAFPSHMRYLEQAFSQLSEADLAQLTQLLRQLKQVF